MQEAPGGLPGVSHLEARLAFPVVGIGASAGGLDSLERFFARVPDDPGMAFVVVQHLSPDFRSMMDELLGRHTRMRVRRADDREQIEPNCVYVLPPGKEMIVAGGRLHLSDKDPRQPLTLPIDHFFRSLAQDCGDRGIAVVLSGSGSDGSRGLRDVHLAGGYVLAESGETAAFDGMPESARRTGLVDQVLSPEEMPGAILQRVSHLARGGSGDRADTPPAEGLAAVFELLRREYDIDFTHYKPSTVARRIDRRISLTGAASLGGYVQELRANPSELHALYRDLLIGVTCFFRDRHCFETLETRVIPQIVESRIAHDDVRVWIAGCATGEEVYSLAILFEEAIERAKKPLNVKLFATDVNGGILETASQGLYEADRLEEVSPERLERFFVKRDGAYQVVPALRQMIVFAPHNLLRDAPFTSLDLITCRNLLIYLEPPAQKKAMLLFHFGLKTGGVLFLGSSETPGELIEEFENVDSHCRLYRKSRDVRLSPDFRLPPLQAPFRVRPPAVRHDGALLGIYDHLLDRYMPSAFVVTEAGELIDSFNGAERYLRVKSRRPSPDLADQLQDYLRAPVLGLFQRAARTRAAVWLSDVTVGTGGDRQVLRISVEPLHVQRAARLHYLITFESQSPRPTAETMADVRIDASALATDHVKALEDDLRQARENLQTTVEELETSSEELQSANEELVASNEELQSTNEELHSVNEELYTVNAEYQRKIQELSELNRDVRHLLEATDVATLFLDRDLRIRRFSPLIAQVFDLMETDVGRRISSFAAQVRFDSLLEELQAVLDNGEPRQHEVRSDDDRCYLLRLLPYRTDPSTVEGVVVSMVDVTVLDQARQRLARLSAIVQSTDDAIIGKDAEGRITSWNAGAEQIYGYTAEEAIGQHIALFVPPEHHAETLDALQRVIRGERVAHYETVRVHKDGTRLDVSVRISPVLDESGRIVGASAISRDIGERRRNERRQTAEHAIARVAAEAWSFEEAAPRLLDALCTNLGVDVAELYLPDGTGSLQCTVACSRSSPAVRQAEDTETRETLGVAWAEHACAQGHTVWFTDVEAPGDGAPKPEAATSLGFRTGFAVPITQGDDCLAVVSFGTYEPLPPDGDLLAMVAAMAHTIGQLIRRSRAEAELRQAVAKRDQFLAMLSHELRNPLAAVRTAGEALQHGELEPERRESAHGVIIRQVRHMTHLLDDLLDVSRVTQNRLKLQVEPFDLERAVTTAMEMIQPMAHAGGITLERAPSEDRFVIEGDLVRVAQMLANLLSNAVKYSPPGTTVTLTTRREGGDVVIGVCDQGAGMPPDVLTHAFDMFYQADDTLDRSKSGLGVGLTLVRTIAELHGGTVTATSEGAERGSEFEVRLPLSAMPADAQAPDAGGPPATVRCEIVLVEDHPDNREMIQLLLEFEGHTVQPAADGIEGLALIERCKPDIAFIDIGLPGLDGYSVARRVRENPDLRSVLLIALSGYVQPTDIERARESGFDDHLAKPVTPDQLLRVLRDAQQSRPCRGAREVRKPVPAAGAARADLGQ